MNETPAMATSMAEVVSPNGLEKKESTSSLGLFSSSPAPEEDDPEEEEEEDVLPTRSSRRARTRSPKKSPSKAVRRIVSVDDDEVETPRRTRPRANGTVFTLDNPRSSRRGRRAVALPDEGEEEEQTPRSLRASRGRHSILESTPKKTRKRRREPSPEPEPEPEEAEEETKEEEEVVNGTESSEAVPSDVSEVNGIAESDAPSPEFKGAQHEESELRSTLGVEEEVWDLDAEGEEEDAEGEIDPDFLD